MKYTCIIVFALLVSASCSTEPAIDVNAEAEKLMQVSRDWAQSAKGGDTDEILNYWASNARLMGPDQPVLEGHDQLRQMLEGAASIPGFEIDWEPKSAVVSASGDMGYMIAHKSVKVSDSLGNPIITYYKEVTVWEKRDGEWKNTVDIYNTDPTITSIR